jgi:hypothetical protein
VGLVVPQVVLPARPLSSALRQQPIMLRLSDKMAQSATTYAAKGGVGMGCEVCRTYIKTGCEVDQLIRQVK